MFGKQVNLSVALRFEALVNNLVFRIPETFIKPTHIALTASKHVLSPQIAF